MKKKLSLRKYLKFYLGAFVALVFVGLYFFIPKFFVINYEIGDYNELFGIDVTADSSQPEVIKTDVTHIETPSSVKAIYMTSCVAGTPSFRANLVKLIEETEINSVIIDIKDYSGTMSFKPTNSELMSMWENARCGTSDMKDFINHLHEKQIYVIGRVTVFQDPHLTNLRPDLAVKKASDGSTWKDNKGLSFTDPGAKEVWDYHIKLAKESYGIGFDEINFDYIRFPSDGPMKDIHFTWSKDRAKPDVIESFFSYLHDNLKDTGIVMSADLFGMTTTNTDDLNIGQVLERALPYFDYIAPMVYPSHYPPNWNGFANPNHFPYEIINISMKEAVKRTIANKTTVKTLNNVKIMQSIEKVDEVSGEIFTEEVWSGFYTKDSYSASKMRPWIQDFDYGGNYGPVEVRAQIQATYDAGLNSFMIWAPSNVYTREALLDS